MTPSLDATLRVAYHRDAKMLQSREAHIMQLGDALRVALENHRPGEYPVIMGGTKMKLIGIDAIRAAHQVIEKKTS